MCWGFLLHRKDDRYIRTTKGENMKRHRDPFGYFPGNERGKINPCFECGINTLGIHHVVPVSLGGTKVIPLCETCHSLVHGGVINSELISGGLRKVRNSGKRLGAPIKVTAEIALKVSRMNSEGFSYRDISEALGISTGSICAVLKRSDGCQNI